MNSSEIGEMKLEIRMIKSISKIDRVFRELNDQKSETCGPYSILKISRAILQDSPIVLTEDNLAQLSGTTISEEERDISIRLKGRKEEDLDPKDREKFYPLEMKVSKDEKEHGTSAIGVYRAAEKVFGDGFTITPLYAAKQDRVNFSTEKFSEFTEVIWNNIQGTELNMILNVQVDLLCSNSGMNSPVDLFSFLSQDQCKNLDDWKVGHFVILAGMIRKYTNDRVDTYYILQENYKGRGMSGYLFQPSENLRNALVRKDGSEGGVMVIVPGGKGTALNQDLKRLFDVGIWDNGTPYPE